MQHLPYDPQLHFSLAETYRKQGVLDLALKSFRSAYALAPTQMAIREKLIMSEIEVGNYLQFLFDMQRLRESMLDFIKKVQASPHASKISKALYTYFGTSPYQELIQLGKRKDFTGVIKRGKTFSPNFKSSL